MADPKDCPFCGGVASLYWNYGGQDKHGNDYYYLYVTCRDCGARSRATSTTGDPNDEELYRLPINAWNRRVNE